LLPVRQIAARNINIREFVETDKGSASLRLACLFISQAGRMRYFRQPRRSRYLIPRRYPVSPPHLTAYAPVANVLQPLRINFFPVRWKETDEMVTDNCQRFFCFRITQEPLLTESRLDWHVAAVAESDVVLIWF